MMSGDELVKLVKREMFKRFCQKSNMPEEIWILADSLANNGCEIEDIIEGFSEFSDRMKAREDEDKEALRELLKGLPIILDEEN